MRTVFVFGVSFTAGSLVADGIIYNNLREWLSASIILVSFAGYIICAHRDIIRNIKKYL